MGPASFMVVLVVACFFFVVIAKESKSPFGSENTHHRFLVYQGMVGIEMQVLVGVRRPPVDGDRSERIIQYRDAQV